MKKHNLARNFSLLVATVSLALGYIAADHWVILAVIASMAVLALLMRKQPAFRSGTILLAIYIALAGAGVLLSLSGPLLALGCTSALAAWDLYLFTEDGKDRAAVGPLMEKSHLRSLALASGLGLALALIALSLDLNIPFGLVIALALLAVGGLVYGIRITGRGNS